jgi:tetratricopeptide (TPR) repeat protein
MLAAAARQLLGDALLEEAVYGSGEGDPARQAVLLEQAQAVYQDIVQHYRDRVVPLGVALSGLATVAEQRGEWDEARRWYQAILDDARFDGTPYKSLAEKALAALPRLAEPVTFVAAPPATQPTTTTATAPAEAESASSQASQEADEH